MILFLYFINRHPLYSVPFELAFLEELERRVLFYKLGIAIGIVLVGTYFHAYLTQRFLSHSLWLRQLLFLVVIFLELSVGDSLCNTAGKKLISYLSFRSQVEYQFRMKPATRSGLEHSYVELLLDLSSDDQSRLRKAHAKFQVKNRIGDVLEQK